VWIIKETCQRWKQPIIVIIFIPYHHQHHHHQQQQQHDGDGQQNDTQAQQQHQQQQQPIIEDDDEVANRLLVSSLIKNCPQLQLIQYLADQEMSQDGHYPINRLRNVGLDHAQTSHIVVMDIDFVPSQGLDQHIRYAVSCLCIGSMITLTSYSSSTMGKIL
jgi:hypothetical protein